MNKDNFKYLIMGIISFIVSIFILSIRYELTILYTLLFLIYGAVNLLVFLGLLEKKIYNRIVFIISTFILIIPFLYMLLK